MEQRRRLIVWIVFGIGLLLSGIAWNVTRNQIGRETADSFFDAATAARSRIEFRVNSYANVIAGTRAFQLASGKDFSGKTFADYIASLELGRHYPGIQVIHYAQRITDAERAAFEDAVRRSGERKFSIRPPGKRDEYVVVRFFAPYAGNEAVLGLDLAGEPVRLDALNRVRDSGRLSASGPIALALDPSRYPGIAMRLPIYRTGEPVATPEDRRAAFTGVISASFVVIDVMRKLFSEAELNRLHIRIHDAGPAGDAHEREAPTEKNLMFDSNRLLDGTAVSAAGKRPAGTLSYESTLEVGGRRWDMYFNAGPGFVGPAAQRWLPWAVLLFGLTFSLLLSGLAQALLSSRSRAVEWANRATEDLRMSEARLIEEQRRTRELIEVIPNPIFFKGRDGRYIGVNKAWEKLFGLPRSAFIGKTVHDLYPHQPEIADRLHAKDQALWQSGGSQQYETSITTPQGRTLDTVYYKATYANADGSIAGLIGTIVDITERKATEQRFRALFDNAAVGIATVDLDGVVTDANQKFLDMLGYARAELVDRRMADITASEELRSDTRPGVPARDSATVIESRLVCKDGRVVWARRTISAVCGKDGGTEYLVNVVEDITDRKQEELRRTMEYAVTRALAEEENLTELFSKVIEIICHNMGWEFGLAWTWDGEAEGLKCAASWGADSPELRAFVEDSMQRVIKPKPGEQEGLIRRTYAAGTAVWIANVAPEPGFKRAILIWEAGLHGAFAFPLWRGSEVVGVMEFYQRSAHESEKALIGTAESIGRQIGQYMGRREAEEKLQFVAAHDTLTNLPNRMMFNQRLEHVLTQSRRGSQGLAVMFIDLDHFKTINDTLGHEAGDVLLREVAQRLTGQLRTSDTVARLGGDEFVVLVENISDRALIGSVAQKLIDALMRSFTLSGGEYNVTASIGVSMFPGDGEDAQTLLKHADSAMYRAKELGRNNFRFYAAQPEASARPGSA